jgi:hypothetical protein
LGLDIPKTFIASYLRHLPSRLLRSCVQKPVAGGDYTTTVGEFIARNHDASQVERYPRLVQQRLTRPELRVYRVGEELIGFEVKSEHLDYREDRDAAIEMAAVPGYLAKGLSKLCTSLRVDFGAADFMWDRRRRKFSFLELNTQPMFAAFSDASKGRLADAMLDFLLLRQG